MAEFRTGTYILSIPFAVPIKDDGQLSSLTSALLDAIRRKGGDYNLAIGTPHIGLRWDDEQEAQ